MCSTKIEKFRANIDQIYWKNKSFELKFIVISNNQMMAASDTLTNDSGQFAMSQTLTMIDGLVEICLNNCKYFECDETEAGQRFLCAFRNIIHYAETARESAVDLGTFMHEYDFDESTPGNGYRSMGNVMNACLNHTVKISKYIAQNRGHLLFRKTTYIK